MAKAEFDEGLEIDFEEEESVGEEDSNNEDDLGVAPYLFEPEVDSREEQMLVETESSSRHSENNNRLGNTSWFVNLRFIFRSFVRKFAEINQEDIQ